MLEALIAYHSKALAAEQAVLDTDGNLYSHDQRARARVDRAREQEFVRVLTAVQEKLGAGPRFQHIKRGSAYTEIDIAISQCDRPIQDNDPVTVYRDDAGQLFVRPVAEFADGRFKSLDGRRPLRETERRSRQFPEIDGAAEIAVTLKIGAREVPWLLTNKAFQDIACVTGVLYIEDGDTEDATLLGAWKVLGGEQFPGKDFMLTLRRIP